jgi:hypothetical protein
LFGSLLRFRKDHAGFAGHRVGRGIDIADAVKPRKREQDFRAAFRRRLAADETGVAALRHNRRAGFVGEVEDLRDFRRQARAQHYRRAPAIETAVLDQVSFLLGGVGDGVFLADDGYEARDEVG